MGVAAVNPIADVSSIWLQTMVAVDKQQLLHSKVYMSKFVWCEQPSEILTFPHLVTLLGDLTERPV